ncbi:hypothetical protein MPSEU_000685800 [Mayamaea pseudoterrestris]|nr:hypothetical protein MPSEU_000685800 [Mayamaea pseudoterrestris]
MMLSPQAARMGTVFTTLRKIGSSRGRSTARHRIFPSNSQVSFKSTMASVAVDDDDEDDLRVTRTKNATGSRVAVTCNDEETQKKVRHPMPTNHPSASASTSPSAATHRSHEQAWMVNLGRECDDWLHGPRSADWFTGVHPSSGTCPGVDVHGSIRSVPLPNLSRVTRQAAKEYFDNSWTLFETMFAGLKGDEPFYRPPVHGLRHPQIFYYGHTACLYVNKLRLAGVLDKPVNPYFESIFEVGVDEMLWDDMHKNDMVWPTVSEVREYRKQVYQVVVDAIMNHSSLDNDPKVDQKHPMWALFLGFEHERIHLETSSVLFRETPVHLVQTPENWPPMHPSAYENNGSPTSHPVEGVDYPSNRMIMVEDESSVDLGKPASFPSFGWDNEYGERHVNVPPFYASEHMVTNGAFWQFVEDGGYRTQEYWCDDGWAWRTHRNAKWPFFWNQIGPAGSNEFALRTIFENIAMPWNWPVNVNYYEAKAFCRWKSAHEETPTAKPYRVLTEAEHHVIRNKEHSLNAARKDVHADKVMVTSGQEFARGSSAMNLNLSYSSESPVGAFPASHTGHYDSTGNAWEWTEDHFSPLKGFEVHHVYDDFSTPCFDGKHSMIVGGSFISTGDEASVFARFHFRPHFLQHSGFRLVTSNDEAPATHLFAGNFEGQAAKRDEAQASELLSKGAGSAPDSVYESKQSLHMYLGLHYPSSGQQENVPPIIPHGTNTPTHGLRFPQRVVALLNSLKPELTNNRALDIGCAVGGASFELAKSFGHVDAFDFSASFVHAAHRMQAGESIRFRVPVEADIYEEVEAVHESDVSERVRSKIDFFTGDACKIREMADSGKLSSYDALIMSNLLCRLPDPMACLEDLPLVTNKGGVVVMVTPFSWLTEFTPRSKWLGGFIDPVSKAPIRSKDVLRTVMELNGFEKIHESEMPLIIREHQRKYQYIISEATGWRNVG